MPLYELAIHNQSIHAYLSQQDEAAASALFLLVLDLALPSVISRSD